MSIARMMMIYSLLLVSGCGMFGTDSGSQKPQPLVFGTQNTVAAPVVPSASPSEEQRLAIDRGGPIERQSQFDRPRVPTAGTPGPTTISRAVREVAAEGSAQNASAPLPALAAPTNGEYLTAGGVVVIVSDTPIYAEKVLRDLTPLLSTEAKNRDIASFQRLARSETEKKVYDLIQTELLYSAAVESLSADDKKFAEDRTMEWRKRQITESSGSEGMARQKAKAEGWDFDEKVKDQYRQTMVMLLYQRKWQPRIQVTAEDMRQYYEQHKATEFSEFDEAKFRVIKITAANSGSRETAIDKIKRIRDGQVGRSDADFAEAASSTNDDPALMRSGGQVGISDGWLRKGSYVVKQVEEAVWQIQPGEITEPVEVNNAFYIARLEARKTGRVRSFDDEKVQESIRDTLTKPQLASRREQEIEKLMGQAVIQPQPPRFDPVVEMAIQMYPRWARAAK